MAVSSGTYTIAALTLLTEWWYGMDGIILQ